MTEPAASPRLTESLLPYHEVHRIHDAYAEFLDGGEYERWLELFTADATLTVGKKVYSGQDGIRRFLTAREPHAGRHLTGPPIFVAGTVDHCLVQANFLALQYTDTGLVVKATGRYHDELRIDGGRWRIAARTVRIGGKP
ncbi:hypothetical protein BAY59_27540 [Prauserella coralliicola]|nr:hypothetical protein BAY59_27540 [Prauserella coralliicola]